MDESMRSTAQPQTPFWSNVLARAHAMAIAFVRTLLAPFAADTRAAIEAKAMNMIWVFVGVFIVLAALAVLVDPFFEHLKNFADNLTDVELGTSSAANLA